MKTIEWYVEKIVEASRESIYFINFETEDMSSNQRFPVVGAISETGGFSDDMKRRIFDVSLVMGEHLAQRAATDTDVNFTRKIKAQSERQKEYLAELVDLLIGDEMGLPFSLVDDLLFTTYTDEGVHYVKADLSVQKLSNDTRRGGFIDVDAAAKLLGC